MSHDATNWAIKQRGLKPAAKVVLWHLCDRYHPDNGCFPSQDTLAADCEMSRSSLNEHLKALEELRLIRREQRLDGRTKRQQSTRYLFAFENEFPSVDVSCETQDVVEPCPESGHGAVSGKTPEPCPENGKSRVRIPDTNLVREPVREPPEARERAEEGFQKLWREWPTGDRPDNREGAEASFRKLSAVEQKLAVDLAPAFHKLMVQRRKSSRMFPYLRSKLFAELIDAPPTDKDGDFVITAGRPEWPEWLGEFRRRHGESGVQSILRVGKAVVKTRWPEKELA